MSEWGRTPRSIDMPPTTLDLIVRRRRQMLVHSHIYYRLNESVVDDHTWQRWADELVELQLFNGSDVCFYDWAFADWDASTGYHLPTDSDIERVALRTLQHAQLMALTA